MTPPFKMKLKPASWVGFVCIVPALFVFTGIGGLDDELVEIGKGMELFGSIYREVSSQYVDRVHPFELMKAGIRGMLGALDPYSVFIDEPDRADVDVITLGSYGGIGISITNRNGRHFVSGFLEGAVQPYDPLHLGDEILRVDSLDVLNTSPEALRRILRGKPGTEVSLLVRRFGGSDSLRIPIMRRSVTVRNVSLFDSLSEGIYYIKLDRFGRSAGEDLRALLQVVSRNKALQGVILDLRDNPGGLLESSVDIVGKFVPRGSLVVSTKGRQSIYTHQYYSVEEPLLPSVALVVLINQNSASASEICAGAIQDLDRGVVLGTRSFGKGLVQNVIPLNYNTSLKLTTSKYFIPSGRCIQKTDYSLVKKDGIIIPDEKDSIRAYYTKKGRVVHEAGGIEPDIDIQEDSVPAAVRPILQAGIIFDFVSQYVNIHQQRVVPAQDSDIRKSFKTFLDSVWVDSSDTVYRFYTRMVETARKSAYPSTFFNDAANLESHIRKQQEKLIDENWTAIKHLLDLQFAYHIGLDKLRFQYRLPTDRPLQKALQLLANPREYGLALQSGH